MSIPRIPARLVLRPRLLRRLDRLAALTIIEGLPGSGKTTLAASWVDDLQAVGSHVVWVKATAELDEAALHEVDRFALPQRRVMLVVEDAHLLRDPSVAERLLRVVKGAHQVHVVALADAAHHFHEAAAHHGVETNVLRGSDLAISADEVPEFAAVWGHHLSTESARVLHGLVGGWLLPLRLVLDATPAWAEELATHVAHEFLVSKVLPDIITSPADFSMAMRCAVPEQLDLDLARVVLGEDAGQPHGAGGALAMAQLERQGLLWRVPRHDGAAQWTFPGLLRRVLLDQLDRLDPDAARIAHRDVALALAAAGDRSRSSELLRHARSAGDWALLAQLWVDRGWSLVGEDPAAFAAAYSAIPESTREEHPPLELAAALGDALGSIPIAAGSMRRVETALGHYMQTGRELLGTDKVGDPARHAELLTAAMIAQRSEGNLAEARKLAAEATRELARARSPETDRARTSQVAWFHLQNAITQLLSNNVTSAYELATSAYQIGPNNIVGAGAAGLLAVMQVTAGQTSNARHWLAAHEAVDLTRGGAAGLAELPARVAQAMLALDRLDAQAAEAALSEVPLDVEASGLWPFVVIAHTRYALLFADPLVTLSRLEHVGWLAARRVLNDGTLPDQVLDRCRVDLLLAMGEVNRVRSSLGELHRTRSWLVVPAARFQLITGDAKKALRIAHDGIWRADISARDRLELLAISSHAAAEQGKTELALESFRRAHGLSADSGNRQPLLLPGEVRHELLDATGLELPSDLLAALDAIGPIYPERADLVELSPRELEVLRHLGQHETTAGLARSLSVSINTVKKQIVSLYAKLGVHDRPAALLQGRALGLIGGSTDGELAQGA